ncbi:MAG: ABC transporter substrate-binding protein [Bacteroidales bacterium]
MIFLVLLVGLAGCQTAEEAPQEIHIGLVAYLEGDYLPHSGQPTVNAANLAIEPINAAGGLEVNGQRYPIRLVIEGIEDNSQLAVTAVRQLINQENVSVVIGPQFSSDAIPAGAIAEEAKVPLISPMASNPDVTIGRNHVFRIGFMDDFQGRAVALFAYNELNARRAALLYDVADAYCRGVAGVFQQTFLEAGGQVVASEVYISGDEDFSAQLQRILEQQPDILFLPNYAEDVLLQGQQARAAGLDVPLLGSDGWSITALGNAPEFEGAYLSGQWSDQSPDPVSQAFVTLYEETYGKIPNASAALTYDAFNLLFQVIQAQGSFTPQAIAEGLYTLGPYHGVAGTIDYQTSGDPVKSVIILQIRNGKVIFYQSIEP